MSTVVIGVGNRARGDDAVGLEVARRLRDRVGPDVKVVEITGDVVDLLAAWQGAQAAVVVDAVVSGKSPGALIRYEAGRDRFPGGLTWRSTHQMGFGAAIELARELNQLPAILVLFGVEGAQFDLGAGLSPAVEDAMGRILDTVLREVAVTSAQTAPPSRPGNGASPP